MKERYEGIDGLKAYAILGIALMHILANGKYEASGFVFDQLIPSFTNLVFLFMMVSGFGMCCGYYQKFKEQKIGVGEFYTKRYSKIWPYFALLCVVDFVISPSKSALYEVFANLTLCQGLLPNMNISVIGVSWTLAVIFVFYLLFPFFCFLLENNGYFGLAYFYGFFGVACNILMCLYISISTYKLQRKLDFGIECGVGIGIYLIAVSILVPYMLYYYTYCLLAVELALIDKMKQLERGM